VIDNRSKAVKQFYHMLDKDVADSLDESQRNEIERTIDAMGLVTRHPLDVRKTIPWIGKRYYFVLLAGRDRRRAVRYEKSRLLNFLLTATITLGIIAIIVLALLALYLIKSALGIDVFKHFSFGVWDWFKDLSGI